MSAKRRIYFTSEQKPEIWDHWQRGDSMSSIGRGFDRGSSSIYPLLSRTSSICPPKRKRSRLAPTLDERELISRGIMALHSVGQLHKSSVDQHRTSVVRSIGMVLIIKTALLMQRTGPGLNL
jgi:hypothetical protein